VLWLWPWLLGLFVVVDNFSLTASVASRASLLVLMSRGVADGLFQGRRRRGFEEKKRVRMARFFFAVRRSGAVLVVAVAGV
jgi:hypothetical protein